ncbi:MAG TPA: Stp1/IreP family PP2C-type Ser/Thr phosphatase [Deltaproteobacteria bacterium]|nr:Stp1/IreP family PP2C-type Ser/Thr phosphatase [Deltaproteobacteria bacterium]
MKVTAFGITDTGKVRAGNEDALLLEEKLGLFVVADGMGGHNSGEVASRMAMEVIRDAVSRSAAGEAFVVGTVDPGHSREANLLASAIRLANRTIFEAAADRPEWHGMGTTVVAVLASGNAAAIAHVGDSRVYLLRNRILKQLTADHSLVAEQQRQGLLTEEQARNSKQKNIITRALGQEPEVLVDLLDLELLDGDMLLLCSDGLTGMVSDEEIAALILARTSLEPACRDLIEQANANGGRDNITAVLLAFHKGSAFMSGLKGLFANR